MKMVFKLFKWIGVLALFALLALLLTAVTVWFGWPAMSGLVLALGVVALGLSALAVQKVLHWRNKKRFVSHILTQDTSPLGTSETNLLAGIRAAWDFGLTALQRSPLGRTGNPLHALPWVLVLGTTNSGKTSLIGKTHRVRPVSERLQLTENHSLVWSFLSEAVVLEGHGDFVQPTEISQDTAKQWETFLTLLATERSREALNGLVFTVSVDQLHSQDIQTIYSLATMFRNRLQQLMLVLGTVFPVYMVVTKFDRLPGMAPLLARLPAESLEHALGRLNSPTAPLEGDTFALSTLDGVEADLRNRLEILASQDEPVRGDDLKALLAVRELRDRLALFMETVFRKNPHQPASLLRGLYFTSVVAGPPAVAQNTITTDTFEHSADALSVFATPDSLSVPLGARPPNPLESPAQAEADSRKMSAQETRGCFVSELFSAVIPGDKLLRHQLDTFQTTRSRMIAVCLGAWYVGLFCLCGMFAINTVYDWSVYKATALSTSTGKTGLPLLYEQSERITAIQHARTVWWVPTLGLNRINALEQHEKQRFQTQFSAEQLEPFFAQIDSYLSTKLNKSERFLVIQRLLWLSVAVNTRKATGSSASVRKVRFPLPLGHTIGMVQAASTPEKKANTTQADLWTTSFGHLFLQYLDWMPNGNALDLLEQRVEETSLQALNVKGQKDLSWLVPGVNEHLFLEPVTLLDISSSFGRMPPDAPSIPPAYTLSGYNVIKTFITGLIEATNGNEELQVRIKQFWKEYYLDYAEVWKRLAYSIDSSWSNKMQATSLLEAATTTDLQSYPQIALLSRMAKELQPLLTAGVAPEWVKGVMLMNACFTTALQLERTHNDDELSTLALLYTTFTSKQSPLIQLYQVLGLEYSQMRGVAESVQINYRFIKQLRAVINVISSPESAFQLAQIHYGGVAYGDISTSSLTHAQDLLKQILTPLFPNPASAEISAYCLQSLLRFYGHTLTIQAAGVLDQFWESEVAAPAMLLPAGNEQLAVFGEKGVVIAFLETRAKAFLTRDLGAYRARAMQGENFPFTDDFLSYIQDGQAIAASPLKESYAVNVRSQPTSVNADALEKPVTTILSLQCQDGTTSLENRNYPKHQTFTYIPKQCGSAQLEVRFSALRLTREYHDFSEFLSEFSYGERVFTPNDFPDQAAPLASLGVREIAVRLLPDNAREIIARQSSVVPIMPERITYSW